MTIITAVPPPEAPGKAVSVPTGTGHPAIPGPLRFLGRALRTLWSNGKARVGLIILGLIIADCDIRPGHRAALADRDHVPSVPGPRLRQPCSAPRQPARTSSRN